MFECTGALAKCCKGRVNESSRHANSICSLSEEHQSLAGIKMRLLKLQPPPPPTVRASVPEKPRPPTSLSTNWALCFKAVEITGEEREGMLALLRYVTVWRTRINLTEPLWHRGCLSFVLSIAAAWHRSHEIRPGCISFTCITFYDGFSHRIQQERPHPTPACYTIQEVGLFPKWHHFPGGLSAAKSVI